MCQLTSWLKIARHWDFTPPAPPPNHAGSQQLRFWSPGARDVTLWESCGAELRRCRSQPIDSVTHRPGLTPLCLGHPIGAVRPRESGAACRVSPSQSPIERVLKENTSAGISAPPPFCPPHSLHNPCASLLDILFISSSTI